jgi:hypothetical protein
MEGSYFKHKARSKKIGTIIGWVILGIIGVTAFAVLFGYVVMLLWNWLMPELFGLAEIGFWKAVGIILLAKLIFGGFGGGHGGKSSHSEKRKSKRSKDKSFSNGFSKWKHYEKFWKERGEQAYNEYVREKTEFVEHEDISENEETKDSLREDDNTEEKNDF